MYYSLLQSAIENISSHDISIVLTNANAKIVSSLHDMRPQPYIRDNTYVDPVANDNRECLLLFCPQYWPLHHRCMVSQYMHPLLDLYSSDSTIRKAIDHKLITDCW